MKKNERTVQFYEFTMDTISADGTLSSPNQDDFKLLLKPLAAFLRKGYEIGRGASLVELIDFSFDANSHSLTMLLNKSDPELPDVAYKDRTTKSRRPGTKQASEDIELSAHAILTAASSGKTAILKLTTGAGVRPDRISKLLNAIYRAQKLHKTLAPFRKQSLIASATNSNGAPITYEVNHRFDFKAMPSTALKEILRTGVVTGVELIDSGIADFDTPSTPKTNAEIKRKTIGVVLRSSPQDTGLFKTLVDVARSSHGIDPDTIRLDYKDEAGEPRHQTLNINQLDAAFTRSSKIIFATDHAPRQTVLSKEIVDAMKQLK